MEETAAHGDLTGKIIHIETENPQLTSTDVCMWAFYDIAFADITLTGLSAEHCILSSNNIVLRNTAPAHRVYNVVCPAGAKTLMIQSRKALEDETGPYRPTVGYYSALDIEETVATLTDTVEDMVDVVQNTVPYNAALNTRVSIFPKIAVCGSSSDAGYYYDPDGNAHPRKAASWIANLARQNGIGWSCYAKASATTRTWLASSEYGLSVLENDPVKASLYVLTFGGNDAVQLGSDPSYLGSIADIVGHDLSNYPDTFYGNYARIIDSIMAAAPDCVIVMIMYCDAEDRHSGTRIPAFYDAMVEIARHYGIPHANWADDNWYKTIRATHELGDHATCFEYGGMAAAFERIFSKLYTTVDTYEDGGQVVEVPYWNYFDAWITPGVWKDPWEM